MRVHTAEELEICEEVGRGAFGVVYRGIIKKSGVEVAVKQIDLENDLTDLFEVNKEILILSECRLVQITEYLGCFTRNFKLWVIMEYVNGGSVFELLKPGAITDENVIAGIVKQILLALEYLHNQGKIHRDLKSQNVLVNSAGDVKLTDFGVSTQLASNFSRRNTTVGTPYWMAPEVILNNKGGHSFKADIWSLGCCAYELLVSKPPLQTQYGAMKALRMISRCENNGDFVELIGLDSLEVSADFKSFLSLCFVEDPRERASASKLLTHPFITKNCTDQTEPVQRKEVKKLITRKQLWEQENHVSKPHHFYVPTELVQNQNKWNEEPEEQSFKFDISSINYASATPPSSASVPATRDSSVSPRGTYKQTKHDTYKNNAKQELNKVLNKVFHRMETKNNLSTDQYDQLVSLNTTLLNLMNFNQAPESNRKILICQYLKYFLKELAKNSDDRSSLQRLILPSNFQILETSVVPPTPSKEQASVVTPFDEIESSLFASWIQKMKS